MIGRRLRWDFLRKEEEGATSPLVAATRADDGRNGARRGHSPQRSQGWVAKRAERSPTWTDGGELRDAASCSEREPMPQLGLEHAACPFSSGAPSLPPLALADAAAEAMDQRALAFLTSRALAAQKEQEAAAKEAEEKALVVVETAKEARMKEAKKGGGQALRRHLALW